MFRATFLILIINIFGCASISNQFDSYAKDFPPNVRIMTEMQIVTHCKGYVDTNFTAVRINGLLLQSELLSGNLNISPGEFRIEGICSLKGKVPCDGKSIDYQEKIELSAIVEENTTYVLLVSANEEYKGCSIKMSGIKP